MDDDDDDYGEKSTPDTSCLTFSYDWLVRGEDLHQTDDVEVDGYCSPEFATNHEGLSLFWQLLLDCTNTCHSGQTKIQIKYGLYLIYKGGGGESVMVTRVEFSRMSNGSSVSVGARPFGEILLHKNEPIGTKKFLTVDDGDMIFLSQFPVKLRVSIALSESEFLVGRLFDQQIAKIKDEQEASDQGLIVSRLLRNVRVISKEECTEKFQPNPFLDVKVVSKDETTFFCHGVVLIEKSCYFKNLFDSGMIESRSKVAHLPFSMQIVRELIGHIYTNGVPENEDILESSELVEGADMLHLTGLKLACHQMLVKKLNKENAVEMFLLAEKYSLEIMKNLALNIVTSNISSVGADPEVLARFSENLWKEVLKHVEKRLACSRVSV